jgi:hypothetical protein
LSTLALRRSVSAVAWIADARRVNELDYVHCPRNWRLFAGFGAPIDSAQEVHALLCQHLGEAKATFNGAYDIPLRIVAADKGLQHSHFR